MEQKSIELRLAIIAILLPLFFDTLPNIIRGISFPPLTLGLPLVLSYILGASWFFVLIAGLDVVRKERIKKDITNNHIFFERYFGLAVYMTKIIIFAVFSAYLIYVITYIIGKFVIIYDVSLFLALAVYILLLYTIYIRVYKHLSD